MKLSQERENILINLSGRVIADGSSSLNSFVILFEGDEGILIEAGGTADRPEISVSLKNAQDLPKLSEAVCAVDWSWISGSKISGAVVDGKQFRLLLEPAGPLTVTCAFWQGQAFLGFQPYRPARKA